MPQQSPTPIPVYAHTVPGVEEIAWLEIRERFPEASFQQFLFAENSNGIVVFDFPGNLRGLSELRTIETVFLRVASVEKISRGYRDLNQLTRQLVSTGDLGRVVNTLSRYRRRQPATYRIVTRKYGNHEYDRRDIRQAVDKAVEALYPEWQFADRNPEVEIWVNVLGSHILAGVLLATREGPSSPASLIPPSVVSAAVFLSDPAGSDRFVDLFCGAGAIVAERARAGPSQLLLGGDPDGAKVADARRHAAQAQLATWHGDALPLPEAAATVVVTQFPEQGQERYGQWLGELARVLAPGGRAILLTRSYEQLKTAIRDYPALQIQTGYSVLWGRRWRRIYVVART